MESAQFHPTSVGVTTTTPRFVSLSRPTTDSKKDGFDKREKHANNVISINDDDDDEAKRPQKKLRATTITP